MYKEHGGGAAVPAQLAGVPGAGGAAVVVGEGAGSHRHPVPAVAGGAGHPEQCLTLGQPSNTDISCGKWKGRKLLFHKNIYHTVYRL